MHSRDDWHTRAEPGVLAGGAATGGEFLQRIASRTHDYISSVTSEFPRFGLRGSSSRPQLGSDFRLT